MIKRKLRIVLLLFSLLLAQVVVAPYFSLGGAQPQFSIPLCVYLGITRFSISSALGAFGWGLVMDCLTGSVVGPWAGGSIAAFLFAGLTARSAFLPSLPIVAGVLFLASLIAFEIFHGLHLADTAVTPTISLVLGEVAITTLTGLALVWFIRWWLEPSPGRTSRDPHHGARRYG
jgi:rod shape-determining protein MreD